MIKNRFGPILMFKHIFLFISLLLFSSGLFAQKATADSIFQLEKAVVKGYLSTQPLLQTPTSVGIVTSQGLRNQVDETFLPALNSLPGVRMEERSPGSYRLSLRGSLLRSPWGVRNVKIYIDDFPLTDAGGNSYLNLIDTRSIKRVEVLKGPDGSLFGANSGGVVLLDPVGATRDSLGVQGGVSAGSYAMVHQNAALQILGEKSQFNLDQAFIRTDGYRENSAMRRHYIQAMEQWQYNESNELKLFAFYADQQYETPGGLNAEQYAENPQQARQAAGSNPGAIAQQAGIFNQTLFGGISHDASIRPNWRHVISIFGSSTDFENPFITNYEFRDENNLGARTFLEFIGDNPVDENVHWKWNLGLEWQRSQHKISNYDNLGNATPGPLQASDEFKTNNHFYFTRFTMDILQRLTVEAAVSLNFYKYNFEALSGGNSSGESDFSPQWMPRISLSYLLNSNLAWRASISRGYSPPTTAEIRPSNQIVNTDLQAETGWNYETGIRYMSRNNRFQMDASVYFYKMREAIVRQLDGNGEEYFTNAGGTDQLGFESRISYWLLEPNKNGIFQGLRLSNSYTHSQFNFRDYIQNAEDHSGNRLTGVPRNVLVTGIEMNLPKSLALNLQHNFTDEIPLDDANSVYADSYHLIQAKLVWNKRFSNKYDLEFYAGVDNLLNQKYSLGNDINAYGNRFYNAAPERNYFAGINFKL
ncbi:TonB-dependent receptor [Salegentibacter mishustinae]|uniref:TonB-dependent receptor n=1 Tax=Salegentibacter mishustinae TaxID=270918 RepID=UPI001CE1F256|nr:TonB-dependent receptor [Salegentibacter mishustinae]UBZ05585.1 TonB-dependent receptor [Salegentibacter mishustinae]